MHLSCHPLFDNPELPLAGLTHPRKSRGGVAGAAMFIACPTLGCIFWASFGSLGSLTIAMKSHVVSCLGLGTLQFCRVLNPYDIAVEKLSCHAMSLGGTHMTDHLHQTGWLDYKEDALEKSWTPLSAMSNAHYMAGFCGDSVLSIVEQPTDSAGIIRRYVRGVTCSVLALQFTLLCFLGRVSPNEAGDPGSCSPS